MLLTSCRSSPECTFGPNSGAEHRSTVHAIGHHKENRKLFKDQTISLYLGYSFIPDRQTHSMSWESAFLTRMAWRQSPFGHHRSRWQFLTKLLEISRRYLSAIFLSFIMDKRSSSSIVLWQLSPGQQILSSFDRSFTWVLMYWFQQSMHKKWPHSEPNICDTFSSSKHTIHVLSWVLALSDSL